MNFNKIILIDFSLENNLFFILINKKIISKNFKNYNKTENIVDLFYKFIQKKKIKIDKSFSIIINVGPGNIVSIRNSIVIGKMISLIYQCNLLSFTNFELLIAKKYKKKKAVILLKNKNILIDLYNRKSVKLSKIRSIVGDRYKIDLSFDKEDVKSLILLNKFSKKIVPISYSTI